MPKLAYGLTEQNTSPDGFQMRSYFLCPHFRHSNLCNPPEPTPYIPIHMDNPPVSPHLYHFTLVCKYYVIMKYLPWLFSQTGL